MTPRHPLLRGRPPKRATRPKPVNRKRKAREFERAYFSTDRVQFINALPCLLGEKVSHGTVADRWKTENAHVPSHSGAGRKGSYLKVVNLCQWHHQLSSASLHSLGKEGFERMWKIDLDEECARVEELWQASLGAPTP